MTPGLFIRVFVVLVVLLWFLATDGVLTTLISVVLGLALGSAILLLTDWLDQWWAHR